MPKCCRVLPIHTGGQALDLRGANSDYRGRAGKPHQSKTGSEKKDEHFSEESSRREVSVPDQHRVNGVLEGLAHSSSDFEHSVPDLGLVVLEPLFVACHP